MNVCTKPSLSPLAEPNRRRIAVLEVGCGLQIKRARNKSEQIVSELRAKGVEVRVLGLHLCLTRRLHLFASIPPIPSKPITPSM